MKTCSLDVREQMARLVDGYETGEETLRASADMTEAELDRLAKSHGLTLYRPGEYADGSEDRVVLTDSHYAYAIGADGKPDTIAG